MTRRYFANNYFILLYVASFDAIINLITSSLLSSANHRRIALYFRFLPARLQIFSKF